MKREASILALTLVLVGCYDRAARERRKVHSEEYTAQRLTEILAKAASAGGSNSKRSRTFRYWNTAYQELHVCTDFDALRENQIDLDIAWNRVVAALRTIPSAGVDQDAVTAISHFADGMEASRHVWDSNGEKAGENTANDLSKNPDAGGASAAGAAIGEAVAETAKSIVAMENIRHEADRKLDATRRVLEARYEDQYPVIALGN